MVVDPTFDMPLAFARQLKATYDQTAAIQALHAEITAIKDNGASLTWGQENLLLGLLPPPAP